MNRESLIKELRTTEALKLGYLGPEGKLATIAKFLGSPIYHQEIGELNNLYDPYEDISENSFPVLNEEDVSVITGYQFYGLSRGINFIINLDIESNDINCEFESNEVYSEVDGELECYFPSQDWEKHIEKLYTSALNIKNSIIEKYKQINSMREFIGKQKKLKELKEKWGI